jgi:periplasmic mercuric ion binding protein
MIKGKFIPTLLMLLLLGVSLVAQRGPSMTIYFTTLGNCGICQNRIQKAVKELPGIDTVYWNIPKKQTTVTYDESITNPYTIMHAIANAGHDNEWFPAPDSAYNLLIGSCCEYQRTINYDTVKVGYFPLMGIWIYPLTIQKTGQSDFRVYPTIGTGVFRFSLEGFRIPDKFQLSVYSMKGTKVLASEFVAGTGNSVDLRSFPNGEYFLVLSDKNQVIASSKVIKIE